jgi:hypothetical protein
MSTITAYAAAAQLSVVEVTVVEMNPIIFSAKVKGNLRNTIQEDGKIYRLDVESNSAIEITAASITEQAKTDIMAGKGSEWVQIAEAFGLITKISFKKDKSEAKGSTDLDDALSLGFKVTAVTVVPQNDIIFKTKGLQHIEGLTEDSGNYYKLDIESNTATLINPQGVADKAAADILKGKNSDEVVLADYFNLITTITLEKK